MKIKKVQKASRKESKKQNEDRLLPEFIRPDNDELLSDMNLSRRFQELFSPRY